MTATLGRIHLRVKNLDRAVRFYTSVLGLQVRRRESSMAVLEVADSRQQIALHADGTDRVAPPLSLGCQFIGFEVQSRRQLAALYERLGGARATIVDARLARYPELGTFSKYLGRGSMTARRAAIVIASS